MTPVEAPPEDDVAAFRARFRAAEVGPRYSGFAHLAFTSTWALAGIAFALSRLHDVKPLEWLVLPAGFLVANLAEYFGHKGPMHHRRKALAVLFRRHTLQHHAFFSSTSMDAESHRDWKIVLFPPYVILFFLAGLVLPIAGGVFLVAGANAGWLFVSLALGYFVTYEWLHLAYHQPATSLVGRLGPIRALRRHHLRHHDPTRMTRGNFNITFPIGDALFRTVLRD